jgi:glycosyltransferase involved in cell wall biosynthesis
MKIAFCSPGSVEFEDYEKGKILGTETQIIGLARHLQLLGHETIIFRRWKSNTSKQEIINGVRIENIHVEDSLLKERNMVATKLAYSRFLARELKSQIPDVIVLTETISSWVPSSLKLPKIFVTHNPPSWIRFDSGKIGMGVLRAIELKVFRGVDIFVALNRQIQDKLVEKDYSAEFIPNAVEFQNYPVSSDQDGTIISGGRHIPLKGLDVLIRAFGQLSIDLKKDLKLKIVGDGPCTSDLKNLTKELNIDDKVEFTGWLDKKNFIDMISKSSLFVLPSYHEVMPVSLLEAMACGKPIVASDIPGIRDIVVDRRDGYLFQPGNYRQLSQIISQFVGSKDAQQIGSAARSRIESDFTFQRIALKYEAMITKLLTSQ